MKLQFRVPAVMMFAAMTFLSSALLAQQSNSGQSAPKATTPSQTAAPAAQQKPGTPPPTATPYVGGKTAMNQPDYIAAQVDARVNKLKTDLNLTDAQVAKLKEAFTKEATDMKAVNEEYMAQMQAMNAKRHDIQMASQTAVDTTLTAEQKAKQEELRKQAMEEMRNRKPGMPGMPGAYGKPYVVPGTTPATGTTPPAGQAAPANQQKPGTPPPASTPAPKNPGF